jgi:D-amino-acid dehydrogenase
MKVLVMGGGVIGVTTAWYLAEAGCEVTVIDRQDATAMETSFANCGQISPGYATPWAAPGIPLKGLKWLCQADGPLKISPDGSLFQLSWIKQMMANCNYKSYAINKSRMLRLSEYSRDQFIEIRKQLDIKYEGRQGGTLQLFRSQKQLDGMAKDIKVLEECGVPYRALDPNGCAEVEPALAKTKHNLSGGLQLPNDETGDCNMFTQDLTEHCKALGVKFIMGKTITKIEKQNNRITGVFIGAEELVADHYVMALGCFSRHMMLTLGINIPVYPVKGYSMTIPIIDPASAPISTILDESYKVAITRFDNRIRLGGMAELSGYNLTLNPKRRQTLEKVINDLFPDGGNLQQSSFWTGLRPMTPDSTPIVGASSIDNLSLNTGHGTLGWTMCLGSAKLLAAEILGTQPEILIEGLNMSRYTK